jgi:hypothetical protein
VNGRFIAWLRSRLEEEVPITACHDTSQQLERTFENFPVGGASHLGSRAIEHRQIQQLRSSQPEGTVALVTQRIAGVGMNKNIQRGRG